jgi:hypothetical protein
MAKTTVVVSSLDDLRQEFADYLARRAKVALEKAEKMNDNEAEAYRLVAKEFTDAGDFWERLTITLEEKTKRF